MYLFGQAFQFVKGQLSVSALTYKDASLEKDPRSSKLKEVLAKGEELHISLPYVNSLVLDFEYGPLDDGSPSNKLLEVRKTGQTQYELQPGDYGERCTHEFEQQMLEAYTPLLKNPGALEVSMQKLMHAE